MENLMDNRNMKTGADVKGYDLKNDRILQYLDEYLKGYLFVEYSDEYMKKAGVSDFMKGVRIPVSPYDLKNFAGGEGVSAEQIAENMKFVLGCNPNFRFAEAYKKYLKWVIGDRAAADSLIEGVKYVDKKEMIQACICFRTALALKPHMMEAMYNYARVQAQLCGASCRGACRHHAQCFPHCTVGQKRAGSGGYSQGHHFGKL